jgi:GST-like protein
MIDFYYHTSPNARKVLMMLEETGLLYQVRWVDISAGEQYTEAYGQLNPNRKIPALIDHDGPESRPVALFESGAILLYLAEKTHMLLPTSPADRWNAIRWLFWQTSSQGPLLGQAAHFISHAAKRGLSEAYSVERYRNEAVRLYGVLEGQLTEREYVAGEFSIADIAIFPWVRVAKGHGINLDEFPEVTRWSEVIAARPSAQKRLDGDEATKTAAKTNYYNDKTWNLLFGSNATSTAGNPR